ncbi:transposase [Fusarium mundagurra]|uniref:Transposase n=1 Tax=Fusarium mundagurra TaxID=1567541 RepID=A0A8H5XRN8_9HYPO|nr:transposase [Fusarium mundagurra]
MGEDSVEEKSVSEWLRDLPMQMREEETGWELGNVYAAQLNDQMNAMDYMAHLMCWRRKAWELQDRYGELKEEDRKVYEDSERDFEQDKEMISKDGQRKSNSRQIDFLQSMRSRKGRGKEERAKAGNQ